MDDGRRRGRRLWLDSTEAKASFVRLSLGFYACQKEDKRGANEYGRGVLLMGKDSIIVAFGFLGSTSSTQLPSSRPRRGFLLFFRRRLGPHTQHFSPHKITGTTASQGREAAARAWAGVGTWSRRACCRCVGEASSSTRQRLSSILQEVMKLLHRQGSHTHAAST